MQKKITARLYHTESDTSPVLEWLRSLPVDDRHAIGQDLARVVSLTYWNAALLGLA